LGTTYYWRVRAVEPVLSPWSERKSFTTGLGSEIIAASLIRPKAGEREVPIKPVFQWSVIAGADGYELLVSADSRMSNPIVVKAGDYSLF